MLILNGKKFAANVDEFTETLFQPDGTAVGFYKARKRHIDLFNMQWVHIGTINCHGVLCAATPQAAIIAGFSAGPLRNACLKAIGAATSNADASGSYLGLPVYKPARAR